MQQLSPRPSGRRQYQFGPYRLDLEERRLWRDGDAVALTSRVFDILAVLVANSGRPMDKDEIMRQVWPDSIVVLDMRGETYEATAGYRSKFSRELRFSTADENGDTECYNPLDFVAIDPDQRYIDINSIATALLPTT